MKRFNLSNTVSSLLIVFLMSVVISGCGKNESGEMSGDKKKNEATTENTQTSQTNEMSSGSGNEHIMISLPTMQCSTCKKNIETAVKKLDGIESINVVVKEKIAHINYDKSKIDQAKIEGTITAAGYDANDKKADPEAYNELDDCCKLPKDRKEKE